MFKRIGTEESDEISKLSPAIAMKPVLHNEEPPIEFSISRKHLYLSKVIMCKSCINLNLIDCEMNTTKFVIIIIGISNWESLQDCNDCTNREVTFFHRQNKFIITFI